MEIIDLYIRSLLENGLIEPGDKWDFMGYTTIANAWLQDDGSIQFRFEAHFWADSKPVCQYVVLKNGELHFRDNLTWFVPDESNDICFATYRSAREAAYGANITLLATARH